MAYIDVERKCCAGKYQEYRMVNLHSHPHYEIHCLLSGDRLHFFNEKMYRFHAPALIVIPPNTPHETEGGPYERINISVSPSYLNPFQTEVLQKVSLQTFSLSPNHHQALLKLVEDLCEAASQPKSGYIVEALFSYFVVQLSKLGKSKNNPGVSVRQKTPPTILKVIDYLDNHSNEKITLEDLTSRFHISKSTLNYEFKKSTSYTPIDYLLITRLSKAEKLLLETDWPISRIAEKCGFSSPNYFGIIFKKKKRISPATYRKIRK